MPIILETDETKDLLGLKEPVPAALPPEAIKAIQDAGYREDIVMGDDLDVDLNTETERPHQVTETTLHNNQLWIDSVKTLVPLFRKNKSTPTSRYAKKHFGAEEEPEIEMSDLEASQWGIELMGQFNWNLTTMMQMALKMEDAPKRQRYAFYNLMQSYEKLPNFTYDGSVRMMKGVLSDATTYVGVGTLGYGLAARHAAKFAGKTGIKNYLRATLPASVIAGIEGGAYTSLDDAIRQNVKMEADQQDEFSFGQNLLATGTGVLLGGGIGLAAPKVIELGFSAAKKGLETFRSGLDNMVANAQSGTFTTGVGPVDTNVTKKIDVQNREVRERK